MLQSEQFEVLILGSGEAGKLLAWHMAGSGRRTAVVERRWVGGSCPNVACLPSKNEIWSARVTRLTRHAAEFGRTTGTVATDMTKVRQRKRDMVMGEVAFHLQAYKTSGTELIMGSARFTAPKTLEVALNDGGTRTMTGDRVFLNLGTHAAIPNCYSACNFSRLIDTVQVQTLPRQPQGLSQPTADLSAGVRRLHRAGYAQG